MERSHRRCHRRLSARSHTNNTLRSLLLALSDNVHRPVDLHPPSTLHLPLPPLPVHFHRNPLPPSLPKYKPLPPPPNLEPPNLPQLAKRLPLLIRNKLFSPKQNLLQSLLLPPHPLPLHTPRRVKLKSPPPPSNNLPRNPPLKAPKENSISPPIPPPPPLKIKPKIRSNLPKLSS